jgi:phosphohistidine phosphatase SixA
MTVLCVGHEPDMTRWTNQLLSGEELSVSNFGKSSVAALEFNDKPHEATGKKRFFYQAEELLAQL